MSCNCCTLSWEDTETRFLSQVFFSFVVIFSLSLDQFWLRIMKLALTYVSLIHPKLPFITFITFHSKLQNLCTGETRNNQINKTSTDASLQLPLSASMNHCVMHTENWIYILRNIFHSERSNKQINMKYELISGSYKFCNL